MQYLQPDNTNRNIGLWTLYIAMVFVSLTVLETLMEVPASSKQFIESESSWGQAILWI